MIGELRCRRCEKPVPQQSGHVCDRMVQAPSIAILTTSVLQGNLYYELARMVGTDVARRLIRDAWVHLDDTIEGGTDHV